MGVDARMFVRLHAEACLSEAQINKLAAKMCATFGVKHFSINKEERSWFPVRHALSIVPNGVWEQDGPDIVASPGEQFIQVHFWTRYYGDGYERGNWLLIKAVAEFLESHIPSGKVYYGGDSSGICATRFGTTARAKLHRHFLENGHAPYRGYLGRGSMSEICRFCGGMRFNNMGGSLHETFLECDGCGEKRIVSGLRRLVLKPDEDFSAGSRRLEAEITNKQEQAGA